jgi:hypothetical protein
MGDAKMTAKKIDFELAKAKAQWFKVARDRKWDDDIRDHGWRLLRGSILAERMRKAKVKKHDESRELLVVAHGRGEKENL